MGCSLQDAHVSPCSLVPGDTVLDNDIRNLPWSKDSFRTDAS